MKFDKWLVLEKAYPGNIGVMEMIKFYKLATKNEIKEMEKAAEKKDWEGFKSLIEKVTGTKLV